jgi:hypothetical protein
MNEKLTFKQWLAELASTGAVFDPKCKGDFNWVGAPGSTGEVIKGEPIKNSKEKKKKKK